MTGSEYPLSYGEYVLLERLGVGGMSQVDLARKAVVDTDFVRLVVIKRIKADRVDDESFVRMFKDEARITSELHHANITNVYDFGRQGDEYYMVLEYVPGLDLRRIINVLRDRHQRVPLRMALKVLCDVLAGLEYAHEKKDAYGRSMKIVHRDVNPRNVMISFRGEVKLIDFGVAKATHRLEKTQTDHIKGKFAYMAPEQVQGTDIDQRADLFAVGLTMHELITGYGMFYGLSQVQIMHRLLAGRLPELAPPPELDNPGFLMMVHGKSLATDPKDRYQSAGEFRNDLLKVAETLGGVATTDELITFLSRVDPDLETRLRDKAFSYSGPIDAVKELSVQGHGFEITDPPQGDASMSGTRTVTLNASSLMAGSMMLALTAAFVTVALVLAVGVVGLWQAGVFGGSAAVDPVTDVDPDLIGDGGASDPTDPAEIDTATPKPVDAGSSDPVPDPVPVRDAAPVPRWVPQPVPSDVGTADPAPVRPAPITVIVTRPTPDPVPPTPVPEPDPGTSDVAPEPTPKPVPDVVTPVTIPEPEPTPTVKALGTLMVTSDIKGRKVLVDGFDTGQITPATFSWPVGTCSVLVEGYASQDAKVVEGQRKILTFRN